MKQHMHRAYDETVLNLMFGELDIAPKEALKQLKSDETAQCLPGERDNVMEALRP